MRRYITVVFQQFGLAVILGCVLSVAMMVVGVPLTFTLFWKYVFGAYCVGIISFLGLYVALGGD